MAEKKVVDWEGVEVGYRAGVLTIREIGAQFGVSHTLVNRRAKAEKWDRDLAPKIRAKADSLVSKAAVSSSVTVETVKAEIESNAQLQANIRLAQRGDITRSRKLVMSLLGELEQQTDNLGLYEQLAELLFDPTNDDGSPVGKEKADSQNKRLELFNKVVSLSGRTSNMKSLADSLKVLVALEREAFGIDDRVKINEAIGAINITF